MVLVTIDFDWLSYGHNANSNQILDEVKSIYHQLRQLPAHAIGIGALTGPLPPAILALPIDVSHHSKAFSAVLEWIGNPSPNYPNINGLAVGQYICTISEWWVSGKVQIPLFRA
jgi:hypothetical protein